MKIVKFTLIILGASLLLAGCSSGDSNSLLNASKFQQEITKAGVVVLDVRTPDEYAAGHIIQAVNIDVEATDFASKIVSLDKNVVYAVYCHSGRRSAIAIEKLKAAGFTSLFELKDGIAAWQAAGLPLVGA